MSLSDIDRRHATNTVGPGQPRQANCTFIIEFVIAQCSGAPIVIDRKASLAVDIPGAESEARSWLPELRRRHETVPPNGFQIRDAARHIVFRSWSQIAG